MCIASQVNCCDRVHKGLNLGFEVQDDYLKSRLLNAQHTVLLGSELGLPIPAVHQYLQSRPRSHKAGNLTGHSGWQLRSNGHVSPKVFFQSELNSMVFGLEVRGHQSALQRRPTAPSTNLQKRTTRIERSQSRLHRVKSHRDFGQYE
jgi:hypothetical protein